MAGPRKNASKSAKTTKSKKTTPVVESVTPVEESVAETTEIIEEIITPVETAQEEVKTEVVVEEIPAEEVKAEEIVIETSAESKPKRKYNKKPKKEEEVSVEEIPAEKKTAKKSVEINAFIQGAGAEKSLDELAETAKKLSGIKSPKSLNLYIKPYEDDGVAKVYYVVDNIAGHFSLF